SGLLANTAYYYRVVATNSVGTTTGEEQSFTTLAAAPTVRADPATNVTATGATLNGMVNANNATTTDIHFELRTAGGSYTPLAPLPTIASGASDTPVSFNASGLTPNTTYFFRLVATSAGGTATSGEQSFATPAIPPSVTTGPATNVAAASATLNGTVNA